MVAGGDRVKARQTLYGAARQALAGRHARVPRRPARQPVRGLAAADGDLLQRGKGGAGGGHHRCRPQPAHDAKAAAGEGSGDDGAVLAVNRRHFVGRRHLPRHPRASRRQQRKPRKKLALGPGPAR